MEEHKEQKMSSLNDFISELKKDGQRLGRSYQYEVFFIFSDNEAAKLSLMCNKASIPGYRIRTQTGKIYSLQYEIATGIDQDPVWLSFYADVLHKIPRRFLWEMKASLNELSIFPLDDPENDSSYSPKYKDSYSFAMVMNILDENFLPVSMYRFDNCFIRTVQQIPLSYSDTGIPEVTIEVVYERVKSKPLDNHSRSVVSSSDGSVDLAAYGVPKENTNTKEIPAVNRNLLDKAKNAATVLTTKGLFKL